MITIIGNTRTDRHTDRQRDKYTDRQTDRPSPTWFIIENWLSIDRRKKGRKEGRLNWEEKEKGVKVELICTQQQSSFHYSLSSLSLTFCFPSTPFFAVVLHSLIFFSTLQHSLLLFSNHSFFSFLHYSTLLFLIYSRLLPPTISPFFTTSPSPFSPLPSPFSSILTPFLASSPLSPQFPLPFNF